VDEKSGPQKRGHGRDLAWVAALATVLIACLAILVWPIPWVGAGEGADTPPAPDLRTAPWSAQPDGAPTIDEAPATASALFPAGVDYRQALWTLYVAARGDGTLPGDVIIAEPLPAEVVLVEAAAGQERLRVSLLAPFGWTPGARRIRAPSIRVPAGVTLAEVREVMAAVAAGDESKLSGIEVDVPRLLPCQVAVGTPHNRPPCE